MISDLPSGCLSVRCPLFVHLTPIPRSTILSSLSGERGFLSMKPGANSRPVKGHCRKGFQGQSLRVKVIAR